MRRTTPDLVGSRKNVYSYVSIGLLALTIGYVLWTNYVIFVGGNLPLTPISLGSGSTGAGLTMLFVGDLIAVMVLWFVIDGVLLSLLHMVLRAGNPQTSATAQQGQQQWQPDQWQSQQWQPQPAQQQWQPQQPWQPQPAQQQWQPQQQWPGQQQWQPQPPQQQWQQWPSSPPPASPPAPRDGGARETLVAPESARPDAYGPGGSVANDAAPVHHRWMPPPAG